MEFVAEDGLFLGAAMAEGGPGHLPRGAGLGDVVELHDRHGEAVNDAVRVLRPVRGAWTGPDAGN